MNKYVTDEDWPALGQFNYGDKGFRSKRKLTKKQRQGRGEES